MSKEDLTVDGIAPHVKEVECCSVCQHYDNRSTDRYADIRCSRHGDLFTSPNWICDDFRTPQLVNITHLSRICSEIQEEFGSSGLNDGIHKEFLVAVITRYVNEVEE